MAKKAAKKKAPKKKKKAAKKKAAKTASKKVASKKAKKAAPKKKKRAARARAFRREDIPGIVARLRDMADPFEVARILGVPITRLRARQIRDPGRTPQETVNDFFVA